MKIGYNKIYSVLFFMLTGLICCLGVVSRRMGENIPVYSGVTFWVSFLFAMLLLFRTYVEINQNYVFIYGLTFGMKKYRVHTARDFSIEGKDVFVMSEGERKKLPVYLWLVDPGGWKAFLKWIQTSNQQAGSG